MIDGLIRTFLRTPILALILAVAIAIFGWRAYEENPKDAIPDIAENQAIVFTEWMGRSPKDVDEQVTYPLTVALQGVPGVREVRATSGFGWSIIYIVFNDETEFYWARSRVLERLNVAQSSLPEGVRPALGPDATALGQIFWYTIDNGWTCDAHPGLRFDEDGRLSHASRTAQLKSDPSSAARLDAAEARQCPLDGRALTFSAAPLDQRRAIQDFDVKLALEGVAGVSEVASIGGYVRQYQIDVRPEALRAYRVTLASLAKAVRESNVDVGAKVVEQNGMEVLVRGVGFLGGVDRNIGDRRQREAATIRDIENIVVKAVDGAPIYVRQIADVTTGPDFRRGALDKMGAEAVGASVIMRYGENPLDVIERIKAKLPEIEAGMPPGLRINAFYDRSGLIDETMGTLATALWQEIAITIAVVVLFLLHVRSSLVVAVTLPLAILLAFICMQALDLGSNIMSLAGIAIAIGTMVDMGIVMTENIYQYLTDQRDDFTRVETGPDGESHEVVDVSKRNAVVREAATEVGSAILTAVSTTIVSFLPVFFLEGQSARLFTPLAWTKTFCLAAAVLMALVIVPPLAAFMLRSRRPTRRRALCIASLAAIGAGAGWWTVSRPDASLGHIGEALRHYLGIGAPLDALIVAVLSFVICYLTLRERLRPIEDNFFSRRIIRIYEPTLRVLLRHKRRFLLLPTAIVVWGLGVWLGWGALLRPVVRLTAPTGAPDWSLAFWIHLGMGAVAGLWLIPLALDSGVYVSSRRKEKRRVGRRWTRVAGVIAGVAIAAMLHHWNFADRHRATAAALFAPSDAASTPSEIPLLRKLADDARGIGQEFMPPLDEGDFLYMPSVLPAGSINTVMDVMRKQDIQFARIPEVLTVVGKLGRVDSALDPAPVGMLETVIALKPRSEWPLVEDPDHSDRQRRRTMDEIWAEIQRAGAFPGVLPSVQLQPIRTRVEMLSTGLNAKIGLKLYGDSIERCELAAVAIESLLRRKLDHAEAVNAVRVNGKPYLEFHIDREAIARYGVNIRDVQNVIEMAIGGMNLTTTYEGLDRYPVRVRYQRELRDSVPDLERTLIATPGGAQIPISLVADVQWVVGPMSVRREGAKFVSYVTMSNVGVDETTLVERGKAIIHDAIVDGDLRLPEGVTQKWAGSYERNLRAKERLLLLVPLVLAINFVLIYLQFKRLPLTFVVFLAIPVAFAGGFILLDYWPAIQNALYAAGLMDRGFAGDAMYLTVAVWVGFIALFGIAVDDGIVLGTYLDQTFSRRPIREYEEIEQRVVDAGLRRIRPCLMTTATTLAALVPVMISTGRGSDVMVPMAIPVFGGMLVELVTLFVVPVCYCGLKQLKWRFGLPDQDFARLAHA
ncbi:MAG TPA: efflux RND transporter permease subunit [Phycisphaerae bacterium]|nr:efflux RND transporter permease subunit [Phycisphaerae bacterium]HRW51770.1 efflux RND transporter permease subunit [Phycisphaerae bacterium]